MTTRRSTTIGALSVVLAVGLAACSSESVGDSGDAAPEPAASDTADDTASAPAEEESEAPAADDFVVASQEIVDANLGATEGFSPPTEGPAAADAASIVYVAADLSNGGIAGVADGVQEAVDAIGWELEVIGASSESGAQGRTDALNQAIAAQPDGIVLGGFDATEQQAAIQQAADLGIPVVGWHAAAQPGALPEANLFTNVTTDPIEVSELAAAYAVAESDGTAGVVIFTDSQFDVAVAKADAIQAYVEQCEGCQVLSYEDSPIAESATEMPALVSSLLQTYGDDLTYMLAINGNYFGGAQSALRDAGKEGAGPPFQIAAGDGDAAEFQRIRTADYQTATVAEPLYLQGWQLVDEVNRAIAGEPESGFVVKPGLIDATNVPDGDVFDPDSGYRETYQSIWGG